MSKLGVVALGVILVCLWAFYGFSIVAGNAALRERVARAQIPSYTGYAVEGACLYITPQGGAIALREWRGWSRAELERQKKCQ